MRRILLLAAFAPVLAAADLHYTLQPEPDSSTVLVNLTIDSGRAEEDFRIPAWCPGFYFLLHYENKISDFRAYDGNGHTLEVDNSTPRQWHVSNPEQGTIKIIYRVTGDDGGLGFFGVNVRDDKAFCNGAATFVYPTTRLREKTDLQVKLPAGWDIATGMDKGPLGHYISSGYDELIDHPIQMGIFARRKFDVKGVPFEAIFVSVDNKYPDLDAAVDRLQKVSAPAISLFGKSGFKHYTYLLHLAVGDFAGGLEHRASTCIAIPNSQRLIIDDLAAHEYFHAWNVKQIRPYVLGPFDYTQQVRTGNLWFAEGVTDYYAKITTYRSGLADQNWLLGQMSSEIRGLQRSSDRKKLSIADCSKQAWEHGGFGVGDLSYYTKGLVIGLLLDAKIRAVTGGEKSLDDVMRLMFDKHHLPQPGYPEEGILKAINEVSGHDLAELYRKMVLSTDELPYELLSGIGLRWDGTNVVVDSGMSAAASKRRDEWLRK